MLMSDNINIFCTPHKSVQHKFELVELHLFLIFYYIYIIYIYISLTTMTTLKRCLNSIQFIHNDFIINNDMFKGLFSLKYVGSFSVSFFSNLKLCRVWKFLEISTFFLLKFSNCTFVCQLSVC